MQKVPGAQGPQGELTELSVTGAHELAAAAETATAEERASTSSTAMTLHGAGAIVGKGRGAGAATTADLSDLAVCAAEVRPEPPPVSSTFVSPSGIRLKVNRGQTFNVESNVLKFIVIVPVEALKRDRPTKTSQDSVELSL